MIFKQSVVTLALAMLTNAAEQHHGGAFTYQSDAETGPEHWAEIVDMAENSCGGDSQSPINIITHAEDYSSKGCEAYMDYEFTNGDCTWEDVEFTISDHNIQLTYTGETCKKDTVVLPDLGETYELIQMHIHTGTEHSFDGLVNAGEIHFVHQDTGDSGKLAVIGVMIQVGLSKDEDILCHLLDQWKEVANEAYEACKPTSFGRHLESDNEEEDDLESDVESNTEEDDNESDNGEEDETYIEKVDNITNEHLDKTVPLNLYNLIPEGEAFYRYEGSLTTPPCSEIVSWSVATIPLQISSTEEMDFVKLMLNYQDPENCEVTTVASAGGSTSRPQQPLNGREVTLICPTSLEQKDSSSRNSPSNLENVPTNIEDNDKDDSGAASQKFCMSFVFLAAGIILSIL